MLKITHKLFRASGVLVFLLGMVFGPSLSFSNEIKNKPTIVSLDYCSDQFALSLADIEQIIAVSKSAEDIYSFYRNRAKGIPKTHSSIEEVIVLNPDVAVQTYSAAAHMGEMTKRTGITLVTTDFGSDPDTVYKNIMKVGKAIGQEERAGRFNKSYAMRLETLKNIPRNKLKIAYITPSGTTAGVGTSVDDIIILSGFESYAQAHNLNGWLSLPIENLIMDPPDLFITGFYEKGAVTQSSWSISRHDHLFKMMKEIPTINLPSSYMSCNGLFTVDAAERIRSDAIELGVISIKSRKVDD
ncbi:MAG: ABC transporter substrate-binding protein [Emcibacteraceae bacterium]|nr:ABC transporter substrate-binding protein [Emcibacteraceae bacterium]